MAMAMAAASAGSERKTRKQKSADRLAETTKFAASLRSGTTTLEEFNTFFWLSEAEKEAVRQRAAADPQAFTAAKRNGYFLGLDGRYGRLGTIARIMFGTPDGAQEWVDPASDDGGGDGGFTWSEVDADKADMIDDYDKEPMPALGLHGRVPLTAAAREAVEAAIAAALAADVEYVYEEEHSEEEAALPENATPALRKATAEAEEQRVNELLRAAGVNKPGTLSQCVRAGLIRGAFGFTFTGAAAELDRQIVVKNPSQAKCHSCGERVDLPTVRQLLEQPDYTGTDYEEGGAMAVFQCKNCGCGVYITEACAGFPQTDSGKFHNHCSECPGLGRCAGDYRYSHCEHCGRHYWRSGSCSCFVLRKTIQRARAGDRTALAALFFHEQLFASNAGGDDDDDENEE